MPASAQKSEQILAGLRRLSRSRLPGQTFTPLQIARECGCRDRSIVFLERKAQRNLARRLQALCPDLLEAVFQGRPITELLGRVQKDPYRSGRAFVRPKAEVKVSKIREVPLHQLISEVAPVRPERNFNRRRAAESCELAHV